MALPGPVAESNGKPDEPWKPPQRPGKLGIGYDELGAEMAPNARVWKKYVEETDRMDKELVEGWNKYHLDFRMSDAQRCDQRPTYDPMIGQAALFSAISTAFVIESSKDLKPDYSQTSAQTLQLMSQTLSAIARGAPLNDSDTTVSEAQAFSPSSSAVAVNTLWFLSLGLSVAVSLIAILAKEWCHSFMAGRVGSMLRQARLRQQRWNGIEQWKMKEILYVLPLLMHTALLLFAVGLSLYLWDIDVRVALPVVITTSLSVLFYVVTVSLPLFFRFCPYTTALARFLYPYWLALLGNRHTLDSIGALVAFLAWVSHTWVRTKQAINRRFRPIAQGPRQDDDIEAAEDSQRGTSPFSFSDAMGGAHYPIRQWVESMRAMFSTDRSQLVEKYTPMDNVTSSMIAWMIVNCEDSRSVDIASQALAGAGYPLPRLPLWECGAIDILCWRIYDHTRALESISSDDPQIVRDTALDDASLFSRSFHFLTAFVEGEGLDLTNPSKPCFIVKANHEVAAKLQNTAYEAHYCLCYRLDEILTYAWKQPTPRYDIVAYEFNVVPVRASMDLWDKMESSREQCQKQQDLVQHISSGKVTNLPSSAVIALISGITKTYLYNASQSPILLMNLLHLLDLEFSNNPFSDQISALAIGLAVAVLATGSYFGADTEEDKWQTIESRLKLARNVYVELAETRYYSYSSTALRFGLLSFLNHKTEGKWTFDAAKIKLIKNQLETYWGIETYRNVLPGVHTTFDSGHHLIRVLTELFDTLPSDLEPDSNPGSASPVLLRIEAALSSHVCRAGSAQIVPFLTQHFTFANSTKLKILCLRGIKHSLGDSSDAVDTALDSLVRTAFLAQMLEVTISTHDDPAMAPYRMEFLWMASRALLDQTNEWCPESRRLVARSLLQSLDNPYKTSSADDGLPNNRDEVGLANLWLPKIDEMCHSDPQAVLDSNLLSVMTEFYEYQDYTNVKPRTAELPSTFDSTWTWLRILQYWEKTCKDAVKKQAKNNTLLDKVIESTSDICRVRRREGEDGSFLDMHDWSI